MDRKSQLNYLVMLNLVFVFSSFDAGLGGKVIEREFALIVNISFVWYVNLIRGGGASIFDGVNDVNMLVLEHEVKGKVVCENRKAIKSSTCNKEGNSIFNLITQSSMGVGACMSGSK